MRLQLARAWIAQGCTVEFVLLQARGELLAQVPPGARVVELGAARFRDAVVPLVRYLRRERPDVLLAALWPLTVIAIAATRLAASGNRVVVSEHGVLSLGYANRGAAHRALLRASLAITYPLADARIGVSRGVVRDLSCLSGLPETVFDVLYNPAAVGESISNAGDPPPELSHLTGPLILTVGALKRAKNHALLLDAFALLDPTLGATLCILGEGALRPQLEARARELGIAARVLLPGFSSRPQDYYARANLFALSSDHEGFGNVLVEALEYGLPIVSTDCPVGPREILEDGCYGALVPTGNAGRLASAIVDGLRRPISAELLKRRARDFLLEDVARRYLEVMMPSHRDALTAQRA
jgi:glycosyltransferase involved in cell wall biosynthesis